jgi:hypothetical protein
LARVSAAPLRGEVRVVMAWQLRYMHCVAPGLSSALPLPGSVPTVLGTSARVISEQAAPPRGWLRRAAGVGRRSSDGARGAQSRVG